MKKYYFILSFFIIFFSGLVIALWWNTGSNLVLKNFNSTLLSENISYETGTANMTRFVKIDRYADIIFGVINFTGYRYPTTTVYIDIETSTGVGGNTVVDAPNAYDENWDTYAKTAVEIADITTVYENRTPLAGAVSDGLDNGVFWESKFGQNLSGSLRAVISCWNFTAPESSGWHTIYLNDTTNTDMNWTTNSTIPKECNSTILTAGGKIAIRTELDNLGGAGMNGSMWYFEGRLKFIQEQSFITSANLDVGNDSSYEWNITTMLNLSNSPNNSSDFANAMNTALSLGGCNCIGCKLEDNNVNCSIPFVFHSASKGILNYHSLSIEYDAKPNVTIQTISNITYNKNPLNLNITSDKYNYSWYVFGTGTNTTFVNNSNITFNQGSNNLSVYINDSNRNTGFSRVNFTIDTLGPTIIINKPTETVTSADVAFNITLSDVNMSLTACNFTVVVSSTGQITNNGSSICGNEITGTFTVPSQDTYNFTYQATDGVQNSNTNTTQFVYSLPSGGVGGGGGGGQPLPSLKDVTALIKHPDDIRDYTVIERALVFSRIFRYVNENGEEFKTDQKIEIIEIISKDMRINNDELNLWIKQFLNDKVEVVSVSSSLSSSLNLILTDVKFSVSPVQKVIDNRFIISPKFFRLEVYKFNFSLLSNYKLKSCETISGVNFTCSVNGSQVIIGYEESDFNFLTKNLASTIELTNMRDNNIFIDSNFQIWNFGLRVIGLPLYIITTFVILSSFGLYYFRRFRIRGRSKK